MGILTKKEQILGAKDLVTEEVEVTEWGGSVIVKSLSGEERDDFEESIFRARGESREMNWHNFRAKLVASSVVDEEGNLIFTLNDIEALGKKNASALDKVFTVAQRLSGLTKKDVENLTKNSKKGQSEDSTSG